MDPAHLQTVFWRAYFPLSLHLYLHLPNNLFTYGVCIINSLNHNISPQYWPWCNNENHQPAAPASLTLRSALVQVALKKKNNNTFSASDPHMCLGFLVLLCDRPCMRMVFRGWVILSSSLWGLKLRSRDMSLGMEDWGVARRRWIEASLGTQVPLWNIRWGNSATVRLGEKIAHAYKTNKKTLKSFSHFYGLYITLCHLSEQWVGGLQQVVMEASVQLQQPQGEVGWSWRREGNTRSKWRVRGIGAELPADHLGPCEEAELSVW